MTALAIYISLDVPQPLAASVAAMRRLVDPDFAHLPVEIALAGSSGIGVIASDNMSAIIAAVERISRSFFPVTTRFIRCAWLSDLRVYALEVEPVTPLLALHEAVRASGLSFAVGVPPTFHPHCAIRWTPDWLTRTQEAAWSKLRAPQQEFVLNDLAIYALAPGSGNAQVIQRVSLGQ